MTGRVFINYRRGDDPGYTQAVYLRLEEALTSDRIFMDVEGNIRGGDDYAEILKRQVAECDVLLAVIGPRWLDIRDQTGQRRIENPDDWVRLEIVSALESGKRVIPVLVGGAELPRAEELPVPLAALPRRQAIRITPERFKADAQGLVNQVVNALSEIEAARREAAEVEFRRRQELARREAEARRRAAEASRGTVAGGSRGHQQVRRLAIGLALVAMVAAGSYIGVLSWLKGAPPSIFEAATREGARTFLAGHDLKSLKSAPFTISGHTREQVEQSFQEIGLWRVLKREFPAWYYSQVAEVVRLRAANADGGEKAISKLLSDAVIRLRRQHGATALKASSEHVTRIAQTFRESLRQFAVHSPQTCYTFVSFGERSEQLLDMMHRPEVAHALQALLISIFEAVADGGVSNLDHGAPLRSDYDLVVTELKAIVWSDEDLGDFADAKKLASLPPAKVCRMVQDWFGAQINVADPAARARLLRESLKPVVVG